MAGDSAARVSALVITWNSAAALEGLLEALRAQTAAVGVVHVDNASADASAALVRRWEGPLVQIENDSNVGFAAALKQAFEAAQGEFVLIVNPDVRLQPTAVERLLGCLDADPGVAAAGPRLLREDGTVEHTCARRLPSLRGSLLTALGLWHVVRGTRLDPYTYRVAEYERDRDVPCLSGAAMLVRRAALERAGGVDARWFMYYEDVDICTRLGRAGRIRYCASAVGRHDGAGSSPRTPALETWLALHVEGALNLYFRTYRSRGAAVTHRALVLLGGALRLVSAGVAFPRSRAAAVRAWAQGSARVRWALSGSMPQGSPRS